MSPMSIAVAIALFGGEPAIININVPADAELYLEGRRMTAHENLAERPFESPPLEEDTDYYYNIEARVVRDGVVKVDRKRVSVRSGQSTDVTLDLPDAPAPDAVIGEENNPIEEAPQAAPPVYQTPRQPQNSPYQPPQYAPRAYQPAPSYPSSNYPSSNYPSGRGVTPSSPYQPYQPGVSSNTSPFGGNSGFRASPGGMGGNSGIYGGNSAQRFSPGGNSGNYGGNSGFRASPGGNSGNYGGNSGYRASPPRR